MENLITRNGLESYTEAYLGTLRDYRIIYGYCRRNNISLVNCSAQTVIDSVPREKFEDVIAGKV